MMYTYSITREEPIAIYGGGKLGLKIARELVDEGYNVVGILDRNPSSINNSPIPVISANDGYKVFGEIFVFVSIVSGHQHMRVYRYLEASGFKKVLFLPLCLRSASAKAMIRAWNSFLAREFNVSIPYCKDLFIVSAEDFILDSIGRQPEIVTAIIHKNHVRAETRNSNSQFASYYPFTTDRTVKGLDVLLDNQDILNWLTPNSQELDNLFESALFFATEFFVNCAAYADYNKRGYFNIIDGHHRSKYLVDRGFTGIPLRIIKSEWEQYFKEQEAQKMMDFCKNIDSLPFPVNHPAFTMFPVQEREPDEEFLRLYNDLCSW